MLLGACGGESPHPAAVSNTSTSPETGGAPRLRECFCYSWVHLDENGESCFSTLADCEVGFEELGRTDKIECRSERRATCGSHACRELGTDCVQR